MTINLQSTAGFGFGSSIIILFGILHFTKRLGPGQNLILMVQALNFVLFCLGCFNCWLVHDISIITSYGAENGALDMIMVMILGLIYMCVALFIGSFVASGSRAPFNLALYATFLLLLVIPTIIFAVKLFTNAANAELYIYTRWDEISQLLPADQPLWTKCPSSEVTRCKEGLAVTTHANFQAVGWLSIAMASVGFFNGLLSITLRKWHHRYDVRQKTGRGETDDVEGGGSGQGNTMRTPQRPNGTTSSDSVGRYGYGTGGMGRGMDGGMDGGTDGGIGIGVGMEGGMEGGTDLASSRTTMDEPETYHIFDDSQSDTLAATPSTAGNTSGTTSGKTTGTRRRANDPAMRWSFISQSGLGLSLSTCLGHAPSSTLRHLRRWAHHHPFISLVVGTALVTAITIGIAFGAYVTALRSSCAVVASGAHGNKTLTTRTATMPIPYGCLCENEFASKVVPTWHPTTNGTCAPSLYSQFGYTCYKLPRLQSISINHEFAFGSVVFTDVNATMTPNMTATLKLLGAKPGTSEQWFNNVTDWFVYNETSSQIEINIQPPIGTTLDVLGYDVSCQSAALEFHIPMPLLDIVVFSTGSVTKQSPFIYCVNSQNNPPPPGQPTGCIDLNVVANHVSISVHSQSDVALSNLGKNGSQSALFTALLDEIPFGDIDIVSNYG